jgi:tRNA1Val (adenine37-N6)-methyltransferase
MANSWFQFKHFRINQDRCAMKISTDAVLLGALAESKFPKNILDIGTGTGVIALMMAQRFPEASVSAVELDDKAAAQAEENFLASKFANRLCLFHSRIQDYNTSNQFDLIVSNPPYFANHLKANVKERNQALHTDTLSFEDLLAQVLRLLKNSGRFWLILPPYQSAIFQKLALEKSLYPKRIFSLQDNPEKPVHREIVEFSFEETEIKCFEIVIKNGDGSPNASYSNLVADFLLNF